ncbi:AraC family transcriptional regulator [Streptomyces hundungensis]|uniref:helix-turn-helix transcriptional regulator n=1 Tax=Streptomyces hundungensis TaxID=1077946 RepID=UPI0031F00175
MDSLAFDSSDLEATEAFLSEAYARMRIGSRTPDASRARIRREATPAVSIDELDLNFDMSYSVTPLGKICLCLVYEGTIQDHSFPGVRDAFGPGDMVLFAPPTAAYAGRICAARYNITMLEPSLLDDVADTLKGPQREPVRLTGHRAHSTEAGAHLKQTIVYVRDHVFGNPAVSGEPLVLSAAHQMLAAGVLGAFPSTAITDPTAEDRTDAHTATVRRAVAYIDDHADLPITVADIAAAAHVTVRAVQYAFRRHLDTTPLAYVRNARLAHAHRALRAATPGGSATVTSIAARWGFPHAGRFAKLYRAAYGTSPSNTLRG